MKQGFIRVIALFLMLGMLIVVLPSAAAVDEDPVVRVGLYYGNSALASANLENETGSGYRLGWFNSAYEFVEVGTTVETQISVLKDTNMYLSSGVYYDTLTAGSSELIGAYHLQLDVPYSSYNEAANAAAEYAGGFPAYINGEYRVRVGSYSTASEAENAADSISQSCSVVGKSSTCYTVTVTRTSKIIFEFDYGTKTAFGIMPDITGVDDHETWFKGYTYYGGFEYKRNTGNNISVINYVRMHDYVKGILPYEMSSSWPLEALKAQALCAKSYTINTMKKHSSSGFDLCNTTDCQVYRGTASANANTDRAVEETYGLYVMYNGGVAQTYYHSCDGGATEDCKNVWSADLPYLKGVIDPYETYDCDYSHTFTTSELAWLLQSKGYNIGEIVKCYVSQTTAVGNVYSVTFVDSNGKTVVVSKSAARSIFYSATLGNTITSQRYTITTNYADGSSGEVSDVYVNTDGDKLTDLNDVYIIGSSGKAQLNSGDIYAITGNGTEKITSNSVSEEGTAVSFTINGSGYGHNVGLSQWGAHDMAKQGFDYQDIIKFYFTGVTIGN